MWRELGPRVALVHQLVSKKHALLSLWVGEDPSMADVADRNIWAEIAAKKFQF